MIYFSIDFDTRQVECKANGNNADNLAEYIIDHELELALAFVSSSEEISEQMSLEEMLETLSKLTGKREKFFSETEAAVRLWELLINKQIGIPEFSAKLGKQLLKAAEKRGKDRPSKQAPEKTKRTERSSVGPRIRSNELVGKIFTQGQIEPKAGIDRWFLWECIEDNLGEADYQDLVDYYVVHVSRKKGKPVSDSEARSKIISAIKRNNIRIL